MGFVTTDESTGRNTRQEQTTNGVDAERKRGRRGRGERIN